MTASARKPLDRELDQALSRCDRIGDQVRRERGEARAAGAARRPARRRACPRAPRSARRARRARRAGRPPRRDEQPDDARSGLRSARRCAACSAVEPLARLRRDLRRVREAVREPAAAELVDPVDLVQDELDRQLRRADLVQHVVDRLDHAVELVVGGRRVDDVQHHVGDERLFERRREAFDELMRQPADEADGVGHEVAAALVLEAARRRVERLEEAVLDRDLGAGERVQQRRLADVRVAGERDRRRLRSGGAPCGASRAGARAPSAASSAPRCGGARCRRSVSSCDSPGPRVPTPPPRRSRCCHMPRMRGRLYSSCASSTWSLPSALTACCAKMSRISCVRSITRAPSASSRKRCCTGSSSSSTSRLSASASSKSSFSSSSLPLPTYVRCAGRGAVLHDAADRLDAGRARELLDLGELVVRICSLGQHREDEPALGLRGTWNHRGALCPLTAPSPTSPSARSSS